MSSVLHVMKGGSVPDGIQHLLLSFVRRASVESRVLSLLPDSPVAAQLKAHGVPVWQTDVRTPAGLAKLRDIRRRAAESRPAVIHAWGHAANAASLLLDPRRKSRLVWSLHDSGPVLFPIKILVALNAFAARRSADAIVSAGRSTKAYYSARRYPTNKLHYIPNGVDLTEFYPDRESGAALRRSLDIEADTPVIAMAGRWAPEKGFTIFARAAERLLEKIPRTRFLLCGPGVSMKTRQVRALLESVNQPNRFHILGYRQEMRAFYSAADVFTCCSTAVDSFGLVAAEAMACGVPPVVTDVGDMSDTVDGHGLVVPKNDPEALADRWHQVLKHPPLGADAEALRQHVCERFSLKLMVEAYEAVYSGAEE